MLERTAKLRKLDSTRIQGWLKNNAPELIHAACLSSLQFERTKSTICELASAIFVDDIKQLCTSSNLRQSSKTAAKETFETFDYDIVWNNMEHIAPSLTSLIKNLVLSKSGKGIVSTVTQQSTVKSLVESGAESGVAENESSDEGDMEGKMATGDTERLRHYLGNAVSRSSKQQSVIMTTVLSSSNGFRSGQNRYPTENRPTFVCSPVGSVLEHGQAGSSRSYFSQVSEKSRSDTRVTQDRPGFYY